MWICHSHLFLLLVSLYHGTAEIAWELELASFWKPRGLIIKVHRASRKDLLLTGLEEHLCSLQSLAFCWLFWWTPCFAGDTSAHKTLLTPFLPKPSLNNAASMGSRSSDSSSIQASVVRHQGKDSQTGTVTGRGWLSCSGDSQPGQTAGHILADGSVHPLTQSCESWVMLETAQGHDSRPDLGWGGWGEQGEAEPLQFRWAVLV